MEFYQLLTLLIFGLVFTVLRESKQTKPLKVLKGVNESVGSSSNQGLLIPFKRKNSNTTENEITQEQSILDEET